ncbi:NlpC/P60 family protein [Streptacidiphilus melanogenes]|uniref:NlpC/P60 family protein n=1 Tax=Streptacidiphilus melanogenes TaxID=411235 RepID=UPI0006945FB1|nr:NlpC/P60 family protein [Streptacidiphilus melanogenes]
MHLVFPGLPSRLARLACATALTATVAQLAGAAAAPATPTTPPAAYAPAARSGTAAASNPVPGAGALPVSTSPGLVAVPAIVADAYRRATAAIAATDPGCHLSWPVLAAIGQVESGQADGGQVTADGTTVHPIVGPALDGQAFAAVRANDGSWARAVGPMQFLPSTWATWGADGNGDGRKDPNNVYDAALAAGHYLCAAGGDLASGSGLDRAIRAYNHSAPYLADVLSWIHRYQHPGQASDSVPPVVQVAAAQTSDPTLQAAVVMAALASASDRPSVAGAAAVRYAVAQLGKPYVWGASGPDTFDCSGLTSQAWAHAGIAIPRTSQDQWAQLQHVPLGELRPGDLVVYFAGASHVALYLGDGRVIQAPRPGAVVDIVPLDRNPVLGAVRPDPGDPALPPPTTPARPGKPTPPRRPTAPGRPKPGEPKPPKPMPLTAPTVTSTQYPAAQAGSPAGTPGTFRLTTAQAAGTAAFQYSLDQPFTSTGVTPTTVQPDPAGQATITLTPSAAGTHTLYVRFTTTDARTSPTTGYRFTVAAPAVRLSALGDLTGDGLTDRIVLDTVGQLQLYRGQSDGTYATTAEPLTHPAPTPAPAPAPATGWNAVTQLTVLPATAASDTPARLEVTENGTTTDYTLDATGELEVWHQP